MEDKKLMIIVILIAIIGVLVSINGLIISWIKDSGGKWLWLFACIGWGFFSASLGDLLNLERTIQS